jgi:hypothetical protein
VASDEAATEGPFLLPPPPFAATEMMTMSTMNPAKPRKIFRTQWRFFFGGGCGGEY